MSGETSEIADGRGDGSVDESAREREFDVCTDAVGTARRGAEDGSTNSFLPRSLRASLLIFDFRAQKMTRRRHASVAAA